MESETTEEKKYAAGLYPVAVPIGNLDDITLRALAVLRRADYIACEDTRVTGMLLQRLGIPKKHLISAHDHNEARRIPEIVAHIRSGGVVALVSDAGTPCISDPGYRIVDAVVREDLSVIPIPGVSAFTMAVVGSGLPIHSFRYVGFPPHKKGRRTFLAGVVASEETVVMYESRYRLGKLFHELVELGASSRRAVIARELTKLHEEFIRGTVAEIARELDRRGEVKGEMAVVLAAAGEGDVLFSGEDE